MVVSSTDMLALVAELNTRRISMILGREARRNGGELRLSPRNIALLTIARRLHHRFHNGDYRHHPDEAGKLRDLCDWLVARHRVNEGATPNGGNLQWDATKLTAKEPPAAGTYPGLILAIRRGQFDA